MRLCHSRSAKRSIQRQPDCRLMFHILGALAEFERSLIAERTRAGLAAAKTRGTLLGRPSKLSKCQIKEALIRIKEKEQLNSVAASLRVSPLTLSRALRRT